MLTRIRISFFFIIGLIAALPSIALAKEGELSIVRITSGWREAESFKRISEYFDGKENTGGQTILRTHPDQRDGYYFLLRTANAGTPVAARINLQIITVNSTKPVVHSFSAGLKSGETVLLLGLTGADWPDPTANPVAWKLELTDAGNQILATEKSFLWEIPPVK